MKLAVEIGKFNNSELYWDIVYIGDCKVFLILDGNIGKYKFANDLGETNYLLYGKYKINKRLVRCNWESSDLRKFLNTDFYNTAFSCIEKNIIFDNEISISSEEMPREYFKNFQGELQCFLLNKDVIDSKSRKAIIVEGSYKKDGYGNNVFSFKKVNNNEEHYVRPCMSVVVHPDTCEKIKEMKKTVHFAQIYRRVDALKKINTNSINRLRDFGRFHNRDLQWIQIGKISNRKLLVFILDGSIGSKSIHSDANFIGDWRNSELKNWLNREFYNNAFNDYEKQLIVPTENGENITLLDLKLYLACSDKNIMFRRKVRPSYEPMEYWIKSSDEDGFYYVNEYTGLKVGESSNKHCVRPVITISTELYSGIEMI